MAAGSRYSDEHRQQAVALYLLHGNWRRVSELTRIPERTLNDWSIQPWFGTMLAELRAEKARELDGTYTRILDEATAQILDRLKHGDPC
jgi:transposase-like protein